MARGDKLREKAKENQKAPTGGKAGMTLQNSDKPIDTRTGGGAPGMACHLEPRPPVRPGPGQATPPPGPQHGPRPRVRPAQPSTGGHKDGPTRPHFHGHTAQARQHGPRPGPPPATLPRPHTAPPRGPRTHGPAPRLFLMRQCGRRAGEPRALGPPPMAMAAARAAPLKTATGGRTRPQARTPGGMPYV